MENHLTQLFQGEFKDIRIDLVLINGKIQFSGIWDLDDLLLHIGSIVHYHLQLEDLVLIGLRNTGCHFSWRVVIDLDGVFMGNHRFFGQTDLLLRIVSHYQFIILVQYSQYRLVLGVLVQQSELFDLKIVSIIGHFDLLVCSLAIIILHDYL